MATEDSPDSEGYEFWRTRNSMTKKARKSNVKVDEIDSDDDEEDNNIHEIINPEESQPTYNPTALFKCPTPNCQKQYVKWGNLLNHIDIGKHKLLPEKVGLYDHALKYFGNQIEDLEKRHNDLFLNESIQEAFLLPENILEKGHALRATAKKTRFSDDVHKFIEEQLEFCKLNDKRPDGKKIEKIMALELNENGKLRFEFSERLNYTQISSLLNRKVKKAENSTVSVQQNLQAQRDEINEELEQETGEIEIEFEDEPLFPTVFDEVHAFTLENEELHADEEKEENELQSNNQGEQQKESKKGRRRKSPHEEQPLNKRTK